MGKRFSKAFTLTELLVVVGIIAFLVLLGVAYLRSQLFKGTDARRKADIKKIQTAVEEYEKDHDCYPLPQFVTCNPGDGLLPYLGDVPCDPSTKASYYYEHEDDVCPDWYRIYTKLENENDSDIIYGIGPGAVFNYVASSPNSPAVTGSSPPPGGGGGGGIPPTNFFGCISGVCVPIGWDSSRPGPECDPNYRSSTCYGQCVYEMTQCNPWK